MDVYVRLYWQHDLDLIALHYSPSVPKVGFLMKEALAAHVRNTPYEVYVPEKIMFRQPIKSCNANVRLYEGKDDDLIDYIKSLHYGLRSNAMKMILRNYLNHMFILPYAQGSGISFKTKLHSNKKQNIAPTSKKALEVEKSSHLTPPVEERKTESPPDSTPQVIPEANVVEKSKPSSSAPVEESPKKEETVVLSEKEPEPVEEDTSSNETFDLFGAIDKMM